MQLAHRQADGSTLREHLLAAAQGGAPPDARLNRQVPREGAALWHAFGELSGCRPPSMGGAAGVPPSEIVAWQALHGVPLTPWEAETLMAMDRAALAVAQQTRVAGGGGA